MTNLKIIEHGVWREYSADPSHPEAGRAVFLKRESDGQDWYEFARGGGGMAEDSVKMTCWPQDGRHIVQAANRDLWMVFPLNALLLEVEGSEAENPQAAFGQKEYHPDSKTFADAPPPCPQIISRRQLFQAAAERGLISEEEALAALSRGAIPARFEAPAARLGRSQQFAARMFLAGGEFDRAHPLARLLGSAEEVKDLWTLGGSL